MALSLPETVEAPNHFAFSVRNKGKLKGFRAQADHHAGVALPSPEGLGHEAQDIASSCRRAGGASETGVDQGMISS